MGYYCSMECLVCGKAVEKPKRGPAPKTCGQRCRKRLSRMKPAPHARLLELSKGRWARSGGRDGKAPVQPNGRMASSTNPSTWSSFEDVQEGPGVGFGVFMGGGLACLDLDNALDGGRLKPWAAAAVEPYLGRVIFAETSVSGRGVHVFVEAPEGRGSSQVVGDGKVEWFPAARFIRTTLKEFKL